MSTVNSQLLDYIDKYVYTIDLINSSTTADLKFTNDVHRAVSSVLNNVALQDEDFDVLVELIDICVDEFVSRVEFLACGYSDGNLVTAYEIGVPFEDFINDLTNRVLVDLDVTLRYKPVNKEIQFEYNPNIDLRVNLKIGKIFSGLYAAGTEPHFAQINSCFPANIGVQLPTLTNPATAQNIQSGMQAIDEDGNVLEGTGHIASTSSIIFSTNGFIEHPDEFSSEAAVMLASTQDTVALSDCGGNCYVLSLFPLLTEASTLSVKKSDGSIGQIELSVTRGSPLAVFHVASKGNATKLKDYVSAFVFGSIDTQSII